MVLLKDFSKAVMMKHWMVYRLVQKTAKTMVVFPEISMAQKMVNQTDYQFVYLMVWKTAEN